MSTKIKDNKKEPHIIKVKSNNLKTIPNYNEKFVVDTSSFENLVKQLVTPKK